MAKQLKLNITIPPKDPSAQRDTRLAYVSQILSDKGGLRGIDFLKQFDKVLQEHPVKYEIGTPIVARVIINLDSLGRMSNYIIDIYGLDFKNYILNKLSYLNLPKSKKRNKSMFPATHSVAARIYISGETFNEIVKDRIHTLNTRDFDAASRSILGTLRSYNIYVK